MSEILNIATNTISNFLSNKAGLKKSKSKAAAVTLIQRFGGSINLNVHFHQLFLDGVYKLEPDGKPGDFHITSPPTIEDLEKVLDKIIQKNNEASRKTRLDLS